MQYAYSLYRTNAAKHLIKRQSYKVSTFKENTLKLLLQKPLVFVKFSFGKYQRFILFSSKVRLIPEGKFQPQQKKLSSVIFRNSLRFALIPDSYIYQVKQDVDYWIIDKSDLNLNPTSNNSLGEIVVSFVVFLTDDRIVLEKIKTIFYRHFRFVEDGQFYDCQSFLINCFDVFTTREIK
jgi:hypothetical protein